MNIYKKTAKRLNVFNQISAHFKQQTEQEEDEYHYGDAASYE